MSRFVRASKFRHVYGQPAKREQCYENVRVSMNAWDTNMISVNPQYMCVNWNAGGGGAFAVIPLSSQGKLAQDFPLFTAHTASVLDTTFSPFHDHIVASCGEDARVMIWEIPEDLASRKEHITEPAVLLQGHNRKVGQVLFNPIADNILVTASADYTMKLWDIEHGAEVQEILGHGEVIQGLDWNWNGSLLATTCKDKKLRLIDVRANKIVQETAGHAGIKGSRVVWLGDTGYLATTGFSRSSERQVYLWSGSNMATSVKQMAIDSSAGILMPFFDNDTKVLYLAGKGDGNIRYYEFENDDLFYLSEFKSSEPQRGMAFMPKRALNIGECEVMRAYKVGSTLIEPISFTVPRKADTFQADLYPPTFAGVPALSADEYLAGENADPVMLDLKDAYNNMAAAMGNVPVSQGSSTDRAGSLNVPGRQKRASSISGTLNVSARSPMLGPRSPSFPTSPGKDMDVESEGLKAENEKLKKQVDEHEARIAALEAQVKSLMGVIQVAEPMTISTSEIADVPPPLLLTPSMEKANPVMTDSPTED